MKRIRTHSDAKPPKPEDISALSWLVKNAVDDGQLPKDLSHQHDHYLYGTAKKISGGRA